MAKPASTKVFRVSGTYKQRHHTQTITKEFVATSPEHAKELLFSYLGSKHAAPRRVIQIGPVVEVPADQAVDPVVRHLVGA